MLAFAVSALFFFLDLPSVELCPVPCECTELRDHGFRVDCSSKLLKEIPVLPENTIELYLQENHLTTVAPGKFDKLQNLRKLNLSSNPWNCDCHIAYLKHWLEDQKLISDSSVLCSTPAVINGKHILNLTGNEYPACKNHELILCKLIIHRNIGIFAVSLLVFLLLACAVHIAKHLSYRVFMAECPLRSNSQRKSGKKK
ncbi:platelet glycoprotein IX-like [Amblyraja radiata]|uniref:platelet glycoprotein IX-like n=1 Tax=Amblyraja radiata TaxID=386614 RepID=UPI0014030564|nr:platelet glycoprotein IX-like [Amblyraja radiata]